VDVLFETAADAFGPALLAIVLTGANHDGARGLAAVSSKGGMAVVQLPASAESRTMPEAALAACKDAIVLEVQDIAELLRQSEGRPI
jgi:two-component system chemotaxis response regulator CheB